MIHYQLRCSQGHGFEGWFRDSVAFEEQASRKLLSCPECGTLKVERALMAPSVRTSRAAAPGAEPPPAAVANKQAVLPDGVRAALQRLRAEIERHCDAVGDGCAEAARRLHREAPPQGSSEANREVRGPSRPPRGIYGRVSEAEREALAEEGIETTQIPWLPRAES